MRVLHVIPAVAPRYGGPSAALSALCAALRDQGVETTIAATDADGDRRLDVSVGVPTLHGGTPALFFRRQFSESLKYSKPLADWLARNVRAFDVVHVHAVLSHACLAAGRACWAAGVPYVVRPLGTLDPWSLAQKALKKRLLLWTIGQRVLARAAAIQYTSAREQQLVEASLGLTRGIVIPLGVECAALDALPGKSELRAKNPYILAMSRLHPVKGLHTLIAAFALACRHADSAWRLVIAGDGDREYLNDLKRAAEERGVGGRVLFSGWVEGADKQRLLEEASLFAVPSLHESFGISLVEALSRGVPAIVSPHVHLADEIQEAEAGWVTGLVPESFERTLLDAMASSEERERRGEAARVLAGRFTWPAVARELVALYARLARTRSPERLRTPDVGLRTS